MRDLNVNVVAALLVTAISALGANDLTCASCHPKQAQSQPETSMARALLASGVNRTLKSNPKLTLLDGSYSYAIERHGEQSLYTVTGGKNSLSLPIGWAFGAGAQTYVLERDGRFYESRVSYYPAIQGLDITVGDQKIHPKTILEAMGRELSPQEVRSCFQCHATGAVVRDRLQLNSLTPGVHCEHCHAGANLHLQAIVHGKSESLPKILGRLSTEEMSNFCGQCHRSWEQVVRERWFGEFNVRFQPYRLANSKCYDGSDRRISCVACHDPHREVVRGENAYDAKCVACHGVATAPHAAQRAASAVAKSCPVAKANCASCHMPKVKLPGGHQIFSDHEIRIVRANEPYPN